MAELNDALTPDLVTCRCPRQWDRNLYSLCTECLTDLWDLTSEAMTAEQPCESPKTQIETPEARTGIDILVCGRRFTVAAGQTLRLGREEGFETEAAFRATINVSRSHARLRYDGERLYVTDTASSNHTFVNDQQLPPETEYELRPGQSLRLASNVPIDVQWERR